MAQTHILLLLEEGKIPEESVLYATELASRMGARLYVLMLNEGPEEALVLQEQKEALDEALSGEKAKEVVENRTVEAGDNASELLKFMAKVPTITTVVWGGKVEALQGRGKGKTEHWFARCKRRLRCMIVAPLAPGEGAGGRESG